MAWIYVTLLNLCLFACFRDVDALSTKVTDHCLSHVLLQHILCTQPGTQPSFWPVLNFLRPGLSFTRAKLNKPCRAIITSLKSQSKSVNWLPAWNTLSITGQHCEMSDSFGYGAAIRMLWQIYHQLRFLRYLYYVEERKILQKRNTLPKSAVMNMIEFFNLKLKHNKNR